MADMTLIEWCDSTFNPWIGCMKVGPGCDHCYAESWDRRFAVSGAAMRWGAGVPRARTGKGNWKLPERWEREHAAFASEHGRRRRVFCASLADVFDNQVPVEWRVDLFTLIAKTPNLDWLLLTKRIGNAEQMMREACGFVEPSPGCYSPRPNVWLGATVVDQAEADRDVPKLLAVPARVRFLSIEPMLGPLDLQRACTYACANGDCFDSGGRRWVVDSENGGTHAECACSRLNGLSWVIVGGESGPKARPMHPDWARSLRDQCAAAGVPFLFKQWGEWCPRGPESLGYPSVDGVPRIRLTDAGHDGQDLASAGGNDVWMNRAGKKAAGRLLDGIEHNGFPEVSPCAA